MNTLARPALNRVHQGHCLEVLRTWPDDFVQTVVTSPPYWGLRNYHADGQIGLEASMAEWLASLVAVFREVRRVLRPDGTCWVNCGDAYATSGYSTHNKGRRAGWQDQPAGWNKAARGQDVADTVTGSGLREKQRLMLPARLALALQADGWWLRDEIVWKKPNPMPLSVRDRTTPAHEMLYLLTKRPRYFFDQEAIKEPIAAASVTRLAQENLDQQPGVAKQDAYEHGFVGQRSRSRRPADILKALAADGQALRNPRSVWTIPTQACSEAHFATFPEKLVVPCIQAGTSEGGGCAVCGTPRRRVVEVGEPDIEAQRASGGDQNGQYGGKGQKDYAGAGVQDPSRVKRNVLESMRVRRTAGWESGCECPGSEVVPCVVLDPFFGSGTTGLVAAKLGRSFLGIELNPDYVRIAEQRVAAEVRQTKML